MQVKRLNRWRAFMIFGLLSAVVCALVFKLFYIQVFDASNLQKKAQKTRQQSLALYNRGRILDRNGVILAQDTLLYDIYAHPSYYFKATPQQIASAVAPVLNLNEAELVLKLNKTEKEAPTITVKKNVPKREVEKLIDSRITLPAEPIKQSRFSLPRMPWQKPADNNPKPRTSPIPGLDYAKKTVRNYPQGTLAAHVLGYVNDEAGISYGIEKTAAYILKKQPASMVRSFLSGRGDVIGVENVTPESLVETPKAEDITLTIDAKLQYIAERELAAGLERTKAKRGAVVMMDPRTGEILAFAAIPTYAPDQYRNATAEELKNWAITDVYPPGSTFKILTLACGLENGVITKDTKLEDTGKMQIGGWTITNYDYGKNGAPGMIDLNYLLQHSSNIGSAKIAMMQKQEQYQALLKKFGIGKQTGIDLEGESNGLFNTETPWDISTHASIGYGYGLAVTPIQLASAVGAIANGGVWVTPHVLKDQKKIVRRRVISEATASTLTDLLEQSITSNKNSPARIEGMPIAGKTGTSRKPSSEGRGYGSDLYTSFIGYFPAKNPDILMMVVVDSPKIGEAWGSTVAVPIFKAIAKETMSYLGLMPTNTIPVKITGTTEERTPRYEQQAANTPHPQNAH